MADNPVNMFSGTIEILSRSLDYRSRNHEMILNNVANADTPQFKPFALNVEAELQKGIQKENGGEMIRTNENHLPGSNFFHSGLPKNARASKGDALLFRGDKNGVNIDEEMTDLARNNLLFKASAQFVAAKFKGLKNAITGGSK
jgi:flagellar basal-body rod protein FlgB